MPSPPSEPAARGLIARWTQRLLLVAPGARKPLARQRIAAGILALVFVIGLVDYLAGYEVSLFVFYCVPVVLATATLGRGFGVVTSVASVITALYGDYAAGVHYSGPLIPVWKGMLALVTYLIFVWLFDTILKLQREMHDRVRQRTAALTAEIAERERLEKTMLEISERERATIGRELHDDLGQHLTGTAFACQVLGEKLQALDLAEQADVQRIVALVEEGIEKTRRLARGLLLAEIPPDGLATALQGLAAETSRRLHVACDFQFDGDCDVADQNTATHLFRIAQEAVNNAVRHGKARHVFITLTSWRDRCELAVHDDGTGLPPPQDRGRGLGLHIMAHRALIIGGKFHIESSGAGDTIARCWLPQPGSTHVS